MQEGLQVRGVQSHNQGQVVHAPPGERFSQELFREGVDGRRLVELRAAQGENGGKRDVLGGNLMPKS